MVQLSAESPHLTVSIFSKSKEELRIISYRSSVIKLTLLHLPWLKTHCLKINLICMKNLCRPILTEQCVFNISCSNGLHSVSTNKHVLKRDWRLVIFLRDRCISFLRTDKTQELLSDFQLNVYNTSYKFCLDCVFSQTVIFCKMCVLE